MPQRIGVFSVKVDLPMERGVIPGAIESEHAAEYWMGFWGDRAPLWAMPVSNIAEIALDARILGNNQTVEGRINQQKNLTSTVKEDMSDLSSFIHRRWNNCFDSGRLLKKQLSDAGWVIKRRKARANKKAGYATELRVKWKKRPQVTKIDYHKMER